METNGLHQTGNPLVREDVDEMIGRRPAPEILLPAPPHDVQIEDWVAQLLGREKGEGSRQAYVHSRCETLLRVAVYISLHEVRFWAHHTEVR